MAQNITLLGASYSDVPAVTLPKTGGGTARFDDCSVVTAEAADVRTGETFVASNGTVTSGSMPNGTATAPTTISGSQATLTTGTNTITLQKTLNVTPRITTAGYISAGTAGSALVSLNANVTTKAATTIYPSASDQSIASGTYTTGAQTIKGVTTSNLTANNIKQGVTVTVGDSDDADRILSVLGTYSGGGGGGGATNFVTGTFTVGSTGGKVETVTIPYTGTGYPIAVLIYVEGGVYNNTSSGQSVWYNSLKRYAAGIMLAIKTITGTAPSYGSGDNNAATTMILYKNSTSSATTYSRTGTQSASFYSTSSTNPTGSPSSCFRFKGDGKTLAYYTGNGTSSSYGLHPDITYRYIIYYSS